jgi:hypothetical protein
MDNSWPAELPEEKHNREQQQQFRRSSMNDDESSKDIHFRDIAPAIEFVCWVVVALAPILRLINGAAVTSDQFVIQVTLFSLALAGGIGLRMYNYLRR